MCDFTGDFTGDPTGESTTTGDPVTGDSTGEFTGVPTITPEEPNASELGDPSKTTEAPGDAASAQTGESSVSLEKTDTLLRSTELSPPDRVSQSVGGAAKEGRDGGEIKEISLTLTAQSIDGGEAWEGREGEAIPGNSLTGKNGENTEGRNGGETAYTSMPREGIAVGGGKGKEVEVSNVKGLNDDKISGGEETGIVEAVETRQKEGNPMEHLIKDLEELSPVASLDEKEAIKISETTKELSKTIDVWVNGKGVKASTDGNGEKEFMISPSRFSPLQDIDEEEETCLEGSGTEVEEGEFRGNIVDGKKEKDVQVASKNMQQGSVPRQLRGRLRAMAEQQLGVLKALDVAKTQLYHFTAIVIAGMGFFTDAYDLFCVSLVTKLLGRLYYFNPLSEKPGSLPPHVAAAVNGVALCGTLAG
ncbi:hypothetical protein YC2023_018650 [Brassica napus]